MKKLPLLLLLLSCGAGRAWAQVRFGIGPQAGYTLASANYQYDGTATYKENFRSGFAAGIIGEVGVGHLTVRPAVLFTQKGFNQERSNLSSPGYTSGSNRTRIDYLVTPLNIGYTQHQNGQGLQAFAGVYYGFALGGHYRYDITYISTLGTVPRTEIFEGNVAPTDKHNTNSSDIQVRTGDIGVQAGIGYRYHDLLVQAEYSWGLRNVDPNDSAGGNYIGSVPYYNRVLQFSLAYLFGPKS